MQKHNVFTLKNCSYSVLMDANPLTILSDISMEIKSSTVALISGRSGSGKTTLLHCLAGLIVPQSGSLCFESMDISKLSSNQRAAYRLKNAGVVYQSFNFLPSLSVEENILLPSIMAGYSQHVARKRCYDLCVELGIDHQRLSYPQTVSGGELQRAALVRALINEPRVILADEPTGNLDTHNRDIIFSTFKKIKQEKSVSIMFTSHDPYAKSIADQIIELDDGKIVGS